MAITRTQTTGKFRISSSTPASGSFGGLPTEGDLIVVVFWGSSNPRWRPQDCTDNQGNTYSLAYTAQDGGILDTAIWWCVTGPTSGTFTVSLDSAVVGNYSGAGAALSFSSTATGFWRPDARAFASGTSTSPATGNTGTLDAAEEVVVAAVGVRAGQASITVESVSPAWTEEAEELNFVAYVPGEVNYRISAATTAQSCSWTLASSGVWTAIICTFVKD
jgi:hypothetical protein